jgi:hypothetical protein
LIMIAQQHIVLPKPGAALLEPTPADGQWPRGAEILIEALLHEGVDSIFGYPGGAVLHIYDELWRYRERITHYLVRHEQGAVHMAEGYARASGRVGVALVTSGPGATNAVTGIANAYMDSTPIVVITGQVPLPLIGTDAFQEVDTVGITRPCVKHNYLVRDVRDLCRFRVLLPLDERAAVVAQQLAQVCFICRRDRLKARLRARGETTLEHFGRQARCLVNEQIDDAARHAGAEPRARIAEHEAAPRSHVLEGEALDVGAGAS